MTAFNIVKGVSGFADLLVCDDVDPLGFIHEPSSKLQEESWCDRVEHFILIMLTTIDHRRVFRSADFFECGIVPEPESSKTLLQDVLFVEDLRVDICNAVVDAPRSKIWI